MKSSYRNGKTHSMSLSFWKHVKTGQVVLSLLLAFLSATSALAEASDSYCLLQGKRKQEIHSDLHVKKEPPPQVTFSVGGESFRVEADGSRLLLKREKEEKPLQQISAPQYEYGKINALALVSNSWLWIDGDETDYTALIRKEKSSLTLATPIPLPEIYTKPCSFWGQWWTECIREQGLYSATLKRAFITGHRANLFGSAKLVSFEVSAGEAKLLPEKIQKATFVTDLPTLKGALFEGTSSEGFFYDGTVVTQLLPAFLDDAEGKGLRRWHVENSGKERIFLSSIGNSKHPFFKEIKAGAQLTTMDVPEEVANEWSRVFTMPDNKKLWMVTRHGVLEEVGSALRKVIVVPKDSFIKGPFGLEQTPDGAITFSVQNESTGVLTPYALVPVSSQCKTALHSKKPILLHL